ncbi:MAG TPA: hypothetical protein DDY14_09310 [Chromatiaceae bacterium]|nr:MAG: hypothetical protein N838_09825 [Thiohalocapsa sp. PB-PSB1]HBG95501.1 hypothetical protein [Chromatiaceae bacterium]HCS89480.1 hypothetical protein [Chromatiaceae bacterium]
MILPRARDRYRFQPMLKARQWVQIIMIGVGFRSMPGLQFVVISKKNMHESFVREIADHDARIPDTVSKHGPIPRPAYNLT